MAEVVQQLLEQQVDELHDYVASGIFSREEVRHIVRRRRSFEYALRRRQTRKVDFLRCIEYELNVDSLRRRRKDERRIMKKHSSPSEFACTRRIMYTFKRALQKFKGDLRLWLQFFTFCERSNSVKSLGKAYAEALQFLPRQDGLWVKAAAWEWSQNNNIAAARVLMQRGIRINPESKALYKEYLRLELLYLDKIRQRRAILGLPSRNVKKSSASSTDDGASDQDMGSGAVADDALDMSDDDEEDDMSDDDSDDGAQGVDLDRLPDEDDGSSETPSGVGSVPQQDGDVDQFLAGAIPRAIIREVQRQFPTDVDFHMELIPVLRLFDDTADLCEEVYAGLGTSGAALAARCMRPLHDVAAADGTDGAPKEQIDVRLQTVVEKFEHAIENSPAAAVQELHEAFATTFDRLLDNEDYALSVPAQRVLTMCQAIVSSSADKAGSKILQLLVRLTRGNMDASLEERLHVLEMAANTTTQQLNFAAACDFWQDWLALTMTVPRDSYDADAVARFGEACQRVNGALDAVGCNVKDVSRMWVWRCNIDYALLYGTRDCIDTVYKQAIAYCIRRAWARLSMSTSDDELASVVGEYLRWVQQVRGPARARVAYGRVLKEIPFAPRWSLLAAIIAFERALAPVEHARVVPLYEKATAAEGATCAEVWHRYMRYLESTGDIDGAGHVYARAVKTLADPDAFISQHSLDRLQAAQEEQD
eukprot:m.967474 g.967474  ORF g.967474 m.967474 type:complete len:706 (-) comp23913_c0_seq25:4521-6638(-)